MLVGLFSTHNMMDIVRGILHWGVFPCSLLYTVYREILEAIKFGEMARNCSGNYLANFKLWQFTRPNDVITHAVNANSHFSLDAARSQKMEMYEVDSCVRGHHVFRGIWNPTIGKQLVCKREASNTQDVYVVAVMRGAHTVRRERNPHI